MGRITKQERMKRETQAQQSLTNIKRNLNAYTQKEIQYVEEMSTGKYGLANKKTLTRLTAIENYSALGLTKKLEKFQLRKQKFTPNNLRWENEKYEENVDAQEYIELPDGKETRFKDMYTKYNTERAKSGESDNDVIQLGRELSNAQKDIDAEKILREEQLKWTNMRQAMRKLYKK